MKKLIPLAILLFCVMSLNSAGRFENPLEEDYIFAESHLRELNQQDFHEWGQGKLNLEILSIARNEIYARRGYNFQSETLDAYFRSKAWYEPATSNEIELSSIEQYNVGLIRYYEHLFEKESQPVIQQKIPPTFRNGIPVVMDLNGDGRQDSLLYTTDHTRFTLTINGVTYQGKGDYLVDSFAIVDIDIEDSLYEIVVSDLGPSDDPNSTFFVYDDMGLEEIGRTNSLFDSGIILDGYGNLNVLTRGSILHTWFFYVQYHLDNNHHIQLVEDKIYTTSGSLYLRKPLTVFENRDENSATSVFKQYSTVDIVGTDNKRWCLVKDEDSREGWFYVDRHSGINGTRFPAYDVFYGLSFAD